MRTLQPVAKYSLSHCDLAPNGGSLRSPQSTRRQLIPNGDVVYERVSRQKEARQMLEETRSRAAEFYSIALLSVRVVLSRNSERSHFSFGIFGLRSPVTRNDIMNLRILLARRISRRLEWEPN